MGNWKKIARRAAAVCVTTVLLASCGSTGGSSTSASTSTASTSTTETAASSGGNVLRVGMECAYAPFNWSQVTPELPDGEQAVPIAGTKYYAYGYDVMMAQKLADTLGMELEIHKVEWTSIGMGLDVGDYDCVIAGMGYTEERAKLYEFTSEYYNRDVCLTVNANGRFADVTGLSQFEGKAPVGVTQLGTVWVGMLSDVPDLKQAPNYETTAECFMAVSTNAADFCLVDYPTAISAARTDSNLKILTLSDDDNLPPAEGTEVCIALKKGNTELRDKLQGALDTLKWDKPQMDEMMEKAIELQPAAA